jgi:hypothetical protein
MLYAPAVAVPVIVAGTIYAAVQQNYRSNANDPQIQIAQDISGQLNAGLTQASQLVTAGTAKTDLKTGLDNFLIVFDSTGKLVVSSAQLDGKVPDMPSGIFSATTASGQDIFTWQPASGVRLATVVMPFTSAGQKGFVAVGRSLKLVEQRIDQLGVVCLAALAVLELLVLVVLVHMETRRRSVPAEEVVPAEETTPMDEGEPTIDPTPKTF